MHLFFLKKNNSKLANVFFLGSNLTTYIYNNLKKNTQEVAH